MTTTDPTTTDPTLADELRRIGHGLSDTYDWPETTAAILRAADVLGLLDPRTIEMVERVLAEDLPDGWTATAGSCIVLTEEATGRKIVATHHRYSTTRWGAVGDDGRYVEANTLAELIELVTA